MSQESENKEGPFYTAEIWKAIAMEIWDEYDAVALYLEAFMSSSNGSKFPFFEKMLPRRFKYFHSYHGRTVTKEEFDKLEEQNRLFTEGMYKSILPKSQL